jgi:hypothetical protein
VGHPLPCGGLLENLDLERLLEAIMQGRDLIFSGTPAGVGPIKAGDKLEGHVDGVGDLAVTYRS